ncbi:MAG: sodium-dependent transporter [Bacteroidia bacterium]|nr:MAG: sodium-dependent transporter [Bacteroidia bacterium]
MSDNQQRESFGSKLGLIAAAAGSAVGLGNIWRFPYELGSYGGAAFLIVYLAFIFVLGIPVMVTEFSIGRHGQANASGSFIKIAPKSPQWSVVGFMGILSSFMIMTFYSTIAGWTLEYMFNSHGLVAGIMSGEVNSGDYFTNFVAHPWHPVAWQLAFMAITAFVILNGVSKGIEASSKILMPLLFVLIIVICVRSLMLDGASAGLEFLFKPDFSKIDASVGLAALGQAFFSLSLGMGALITYGSYINKQENLVNTAFQVSVADTVVAVLAGVMIFPAVFAFGVEPGSGPSLVYITLPNIFAEMALGWLWCLVFFLLLTVAALTSMISLLEANVVYIAEKFKMNRTVATIVGSLAVLVIGVPVTLSQGSGAWAEFQIFGLGLFDLMDFLSAKILMPLGGLLAVVFVGWGPGKNAFELEISNEGTLKSSAIQFVRAMVKYVAPALIAVIFVAGLM